MTIEQSTLLEAEASDSLNKLENGRQSKKGVKPSGQNMFVPVLRRKQADEKEPKIRPKGERDASKPKQPKLDSHLKQISMSDSRKVLQQQASFSNLPFG